MYYCALRARQEGALSLLMSCARTCACTRACALRTLARLARVARDKGPVSDFIMGDVSRVKVLFRPENKGGQGGLAPGMRGVRQGGSCPGHARRETRGPCLGHARHQTQRSCPRYELETRGYCPGHARVRDKRGLASHVALLGQMSCFCDGFCALCCMVECVSHDTQGYVIVDGTRQTG